MAPALIIHATLWGITVRYYDEFVARLGPPNHSEVTMVDEHQTNAIIATAILESVRDHQNSAIDPEQAKLMAKHILAALTDAGLEITLVDQS